MSTIATAAQRARSISELQGHERSVAAELAEWGYHFTGHDGKGAVIMTHPQAGVVRIHHSPKSKTGARLSILRLACQQLRHVGIQVALPWRPTQPKKEEPVSAVAVEDKVKIDARGTKDRIAALIAEGRFGETFTSTDVYEYMSGRYTLPRYSGDSHDRPGSVLVSQALTALWQKGALTRSKDDKRYTYKMVGLPLGPAVQPQTEPVTSPPSEPVATTEESTDNGYVSPTEAALPPVDEVEEHEGLVVPSTPAVPTEALEMLRGFFVGDLEAENELLRECLTHVSQVVTSAAEEIAHAVEAVGEGRHPTGNGKRGVAAVGPLREERLKTIVEKVTHGVEMHYREMAQVSELEERDVNSTLKAAVDNGWQSRDGSRVVRMRRGYYMVVGG